MTLPLDFYLRDDVVQISRELLGKYLFTHFDGHVTGGKIIETEAYRGAEDAACHAYKNRRTPRTEVMFHKGGICYVYLCYGMHYLLNIVTNREKTPHAILIRALEPVKGISIMLERRNKSERDRTLTSGPGSLSKALGINQKLNGASLLEESIWIEEGREVSNPIASPRVGIDYAGKDAKLPWRFRIGS